MFATPYRPEFSAKVWPSGFSSGTGLYSEPKYAGDSLRGKHYFPKFAIGKE